MPCPSMEFEARFFHLQKDTNILLGPVITKREVELSF